MYTVKLPSTSSNGWDPRPVAPRKRAIIGEESRAHAQKQARQLMVPAWDVVG